MSHSRDHHHGHGHGSGLRARLLAAVRPHAHDPSESIQSAEETSGEGVRAAWIGLAGMVSTAVLQMVIVAVSGSIALLADTLHNLGHAVTTIPLVIAFRLGRRPPTEHYPYGYRRVEDIVGLFIALVIALSAALIIWESIDALLDPHEIGHLGWVFAAGIVGAAGNELVAIYRIRVGRKIGSAALIAEGQHARADGLTSLAVVVGVIGVWWGFARADAIVGLLIAGAILWILVNSTRMVVRRLMDGVDPGTIERIDEVAAGVGGVAAVGRSRARWIGHRLEAEVEIAIDGTLTVEAGHDVAEVVHHELLHQVRHLDHVAVHVNPIVSGRSHDELHALSGHHASAEARQAFLAERSSG